MTKKEKLPAGVENAGQAEGETNAAPYEFYIEGEPEEMARPVTKLELDLAVRCAGSFRPDLVFRYRRAKKKRIRRKYAKRILTWYWGALQQCSYRKHRGKVRAWARIRRQS